MKVLELKRDDCAKFLREIADDNPSLEGVIVLGIYKDGTQMIRTSSMSHYEKCFLLAFFQAWLGSWFSFEGWQNDRS